MILTFMFFVNTNISYAMTPSANPEYQGIDVSNWQGYIDYRQVRESRN